MTPADRRVTELIDKWLASIDLHLKYVELSDAAYARTQPWPKHDRPTRWVLEVARQKVLELKAQCETRQAMGDGKFSESLELMSFLANLVGIQHIQRFIPLADPSRAEAASSPGPGTSQTVEAPTIIKPQAHRARPSGDDTTREMPRLKVPAAAKPAAAKPTAAKSAAPEVEARSRSDGAKSPTRSPGVQSRPIPAPKPPPPAVDMKGKIIADAVRLLKWGKQWHELAELIARIAERPPESDIRKVLRTNKNEIEKAAQS